MYNKKCHEIDVRTTENPLKVQKHLHNRNATDIDVYNSFISLRLERA